MVFKVKVEAHCLLDATNQLPGHKKSLLKGKPFSALEPIEVEKKSNPMWLRKKTYKCLKTQT